MATAENSSLRKTFSMSRWAIMFPAVARRSPAMITPSAQTAATIVVPCGRSGPPAAGPARAAARPGSRSGAAMPRKSVNDDVPAVRNGACPRPSKSGATRESFQF
jgi:hypothetical protein